MIDRYNGFEELEANELVGVDFQILVEDRGSPVAIIAPHGGRIEPVTSEIAAAVAGDTLSFYAFEALRPAGERGSLHISSARFDEPQALAIVGKAQTVVAIHGRADGMDPLTVSVGGRDMALGNEIAAGLNAAGFAAAIPTQTHLAGLAPMNICNRTASGKGVQIEIPRTLRDRLKASSGKLAEFCDSIRTQVLRHRV